LVTDTVSLPSDSSVDHVRNLQLLMEIFRR
jgi:hypothetical protein